MVQNLRSALHLLRPMPNSCTPTALRRETRAFFMRHWSEKLGPEPRWFVLDQKVLSAVGAGGCYAVVNSDDQVTYVGLGLVAPRNDKPRRKSGILARLIRHVTARKALMRDGMIVPRKDKWESFGGVAKVLVIPFPAEYDYLAAALEIHLIRTLGGGLVMNKSRVPFVSTRT